MPPPQTPQHISELNPDWQTGALIDNSYTSQETQDVKTIITRKDPLPSLTFHAKRRILII